MNKLFPDEKVTNKNIVIRTLRKEDLEMLSEYFLGLSDQTRQFYGPHPFNREWAEKICGNNDTDDMIRVIALSDETGRERILAYFIIKIGVWGSDMKRYAEIGMPLDNETDCTLAPSVSDDRQSSGLGSMVMAYILKFIPMIGRQRIVLWGGVQAINERAVHFYIKHGFIKVNEFEHNGFLCYDMIMSISGRGGERLSDGKVI
jgi:diamine N-acetyltransferase